MAKNESVQTVGVKVPRMYTVNVPKAGTDYTITLDKADDLNGLVGELVKYSLYVILTRATAGAEGIEDARAAVATRLGSLYAGTFGAGGGPRLDPAFKHARDKVATLLKVKPADIPGWEDIKNLIGADKTAMVRAWAEKLVAASAIDLEL